MYLLSGAELNNRYKIEEVLGHGGFGITYAALDKVLNVKVAIKEYLPRQLATRAEGQTKVSIFTGESRKHYEYGLKKFLEEAQSVAQFSHHPNIVSARDYFEANGTAYMVMEYVEGVTLKEYLGKKGGRISFEEAKGIMMPVMDALREVHQAGMLHRDVSPDNIYITTSAQVKILDFGAARYFAGEQSKSLSVILKSGYAPEEQYRSKGKQGPWTDVYATAATIYKAITGETPTEALDRVAEDTLAPPSRLGVAIPPAAEQALLQALAVNAGQRFYTMGEFQQALLGRKAVTGLVQPPPAEIIRESSPEPPVKPRVGKTNWATPAILISGAVIALVIIVGTFWRWSRTKTPVTPPITMTTTETKPDTTKSTPPIAQVPSPPVQETPQQPQPVKTRFTKSKDGVITDSATGLEWYAGPDRNTDWNQAKSWTESLTVAGGGWRMPTMPELICLFQKDVGPNNLDPIFQPTGSWVWSVQKDASSAWFFNFYDGQELWDSLDSADMSRAFAVRFPRLQPVKTRFTKSKDGVITDGATGLEWYVGPDRKTNWNQAKVWAESLKAAGGGWRMPTMPELKTLYQPGAGRNNLHRGPNNLSLIFQTTGFWVWGVQKDASSAWLFNFGHGQEILDPLYDHDARTFAVRSRR